MIAFKCKNENSFLKNLIGARSFFENNLKQRQNGHYLQAVEVLIAKLCNSKQELKTPPDSVNYLFFRYDRKERTVFIELIVEPRSTQPNGSLKFGFPLITRVKLKDCKETQNEY